MAGALAAQRPDFAQKVPSDRAGGQDGAALVLPQSILCTAGRAAALHRMDCDNLYLADDHGARLNLSVCSQLSA